jgi:hypothetical protein
MGGCGLDSSGLGYSVEATQKNTTPTRWWRKRRTAGANITKTAGRVQSNHNSATAGRYNINKEGTSGRRLVRARDFKNKL